MDCQAPSVHRVSQARILEWVAMPSSKGSSQAGGRTASHALAYRFFTLHHLRSPKNTGVGCHFLLQGIFLTQGLSTSPALAGVSFYSWATREAHLEIYTFHEGFPGGACGKEPSWQRRRCRSDPWAGKIPWRRHGNPSQYCCLENPVDRGAWQATVHRLTQTQTRLKQLRTHTYSINKMWFVSKDESNSRAWGRPREWEQSREKQTPQEECESSQEVRLWNIGCLVLMGWVIS